MHIEVLVEDSSGKRLLEGLIPQFIGPYGEIHTWRLHSYKGIGRIPQNLNSAGDPAKRILLDRLPRLLRGYGKTPGVDAVVVVLDVDRRDCAEFLRELTEMSHACNSGINTLFRLAVEEIEAWYFGDREALLAAYPRANKQVIAGYNQDSVCGTWELLADAVYPGGSEAIRKAGWPLPGHIKHEWAEKIGPLMEPARNTSPSFGKLRDGFQRLVLSP
ncbi:MAG: enolase [Bradyrhizobium sp.]|nr:enolase [Bradyrhizobium sp.]